MAEAESPRRFVFLKRLAFAFFVLIIGTLGAGFLYWKQNGTIAPLLIDIASRVLPLLGDHAPSFPSPFGNVQIRSKKSDRGLFVEISCNPCRMAGEKIGQTPFLLEEGKLSGTFNKGTFQGQLEAQEVKIKIDGLWDGKSFKGNFALPETPIEKLYHMAESICPEAKTAHIEGTVSGNGSFQWPQAFLRWKPRINRFKVSNLVNISVYKSGKFEYPAKDKDGAEVTLESGEGSADWQPWEGMGSFLPQGVVAAEDGSFYYHPGYDVSSMDEALKENQQLKRIRRGASTITQQLAKNLFLSPERSYSRKLRELLYAVNLEQLGKRRILELYLNVVEWGPDLHGAKQAALRFFHKKPAELLPEEAAWMAGIIRSPKRSWTKEYLTGTPNTARLQKVLSRMGSISENERQQAMNRPLSLAR